MRGRAAGAVACLRVPRQPNGYPPTEGAVLIASLLLRAPGSGGACVSGSR